VREPNVRVLAGGLELVLKRDGGGAANANAVETHDRTVTVGV
jgi:hypothetical protein